MGIRLMYLFTDIGSVADIMCVVCISYVVYISFYKHIHELAVIYKHPVLYTKICDKNKQIAILFLCFLNCNLAQLNLK